jgi:hypothetical protein
MDLLNLFMSIITSVKNLIQYAQKQSADKVKLAQELADTQKQLSEALANDKADAETIRLAAEKYDQLQAEANANADKAAQLETKISGLVADNAEAETLIAAILAEPEIVPDKVE